MVKCDGKYQVMIHVIMALNKLSIQKLLGLKHMLQLIFFIFNKVIFFY